MIVPIRCFTCGKVIGHLWERWLDMLKMNVSEGDALDRLDLTRYCCRRMILTHVDLIEKLLVYNNRCAVFGCDGDHRLCRVGSVVEPDFRKVVQVQVLDQDVDLVLAVGENDGVQLEASRQHPRHIVRDGVVVLGDFHQVVPGSLEADVDFERLLRDLGDRAGLENPAEIGTAVRDEEPSVVPDVSDPVVDGELGSDTVVTVVAILDPNDLFGSLRFGGQVDRDRLASHAHEGDLTIRHPAAEGLHDAVALLGERPYHDVGHEVLFCDVDLPHLEVPVVGHKGGVTEGDGTHGDVVEVLAHVELDEPTEPVLAEHIWQHVSKHVHYAERTRLLVPFDEQHGFIPEETLFEHVLAVEPDAFVHLLGDEQLVEVVQELCRKRVALVRRDDVVLVLDGSYLHVRQGGRDMELALLQTRYPEVGVVSVQLRELELHGLGPVEPYAILVGDVGDIGGVIQKALSNERLVHVSDSTDGVQEVVRRRYRVHLAVSVRSDLDALIYVGGRQLQVDDLRLVRRVVTPVRRAVELGFEEPVQEPGVHGEVVGAPHDLHFHLHTTGLVAHVNDALLVENVHNPVVGVTTTVEEDAVFATGRQDLAILRPVVFRQVDVQGIVVQGAVHAVFPGDGQERRLEAVSHVRRGKYIPLVVVELRVPEEDLVIMLEQHFVAASDGSHAPSRFGQESSHSVISAQRFVHEPVEVLRAYVQIIKFFRVILVRATGGFYKPLSVGNTEEDGLNFHNVHETVLFNEGLHDIRSIFRF
ncbi:DNA-directed RNA polymerases and III subunit RPABC5 [Babesia ovata]|uniref:DNA-directed RNA polymerases I, II, and III subunit RPABC5 n=1 Tax=Babesia ovata TaxID=189622 RepID=A0A2H6K8A4_9APIC|nr:DNA-directed RNA polymerases and III subunit RPABC5 [Babesia ovata]GBE59221.1 DNA-directed RNA polymerases and III subunit RPABC5 [Babesia ovata]